jgi:Uma2 family endonuclease
MNPMAVANLASAEQYLRTSFEHDAEFVEGRIIERPVPTWEHACIQGFLIEELRIIGRRLGLFAVPEQRVQERPDRFRVPDVCVVADRPDGAFGRRIVTQPPYLCVEILSPEDTEVETLDKVREYLRFGVKWVWVIDPVSRGGQVHGGNGVSPADDSIFFTDLFSVDLSRAEFQIKADNPQTWIAQVRKRLALLRAERPSTKAGRILALWPDIEAPVDGGQSMKSICNWLEEEVGITLGITSLTSYISRLRRRKAVNRNAKEVTGQSVRLQAGTASVYLLPPLRRYPTIVTKLLCLEHHHK